MSPLDLWGLVMVFKPYLATAMLSLLLSANVCFGSEIFSDKVLSFEIKPNVCIVKKVGEDCQLTFNVEWRTKEPMNICLIKQKNVLQCWNDEQQADESTDVLLTYTTTVDLVDEQQQLLAQAQLQVNAAEPKNRRRRLRSAWSLF